MPLKICIYCVIFSLLLSLDISLFAGDPVPFATTAFDQNWNLVENMSDEFTAAELDTDKWHIQGTDGFYYSNFQGRDTFQFSTDNVRVEDGRLKIQSRYQPDPNSGVTHTTAAVISKNTLNYGYMETRAKVAGGAVSSSFWMTGNGGDQTASELDVFEMFGTSSLNNANLQRRYWSSIHDWSPSGAGKSTWTDIDTYLDFDPTSDFHVYGVEWTEDSLKFLVDGDLLRLVTKEQVEAEGLNGGVWAIDDPLRVWFDSEVFPWLGTPPESASFSVDYEVDYVRVWQPAVAVPEPSCFLLTMIAVTGIAFRRRRLATSGQ